MKNILGLDLGTNSIGAAVVDVENNNIVLATSRIIPMDATIMGNFEKGNKVSQTKDRTMQRGVRRLRERNLLRRERLHRVLNLLSFLPEYYAKNIDFENHYGKFLPQTEPKLAWCEMPNGEFEFIFKNSFEEMLVDFRLNQPSIFRTRGDGSSTLIPYDWTIYYLRKKALSNRISEQELAWIILNFNQKRGYYQLRGEEEEENDSKSIEFHALKVVAVEATDDKKGDQIWYNVHLENGWIYRRTSAKPLDWVGLTKEFIVSTDLDKDGNPIKNKEGDVKRSFRVPDDDDWTLIKKKIEADIFNSGKTVGEFIYDTLLKNPNQKIKGKLVRTVERRFYKDELVQIFNKQKEFHECLTDMSLAKQCAEELYKSNESHRKELEKKDVCNIILNDIIFYQRPLKSKKSLIADCQYEQRCYVDEGVVKKVPLKVVPKSNPFFQEFRLWQFVDNLRIYRLGDTTRNDVDVTSDFIKDKAEVFTWLNDLKEIKPQTFFARKEFGLKRDERTNYRWNYVDKAYPCNETRHMMLYAMTKNGLSTEIVNDKNKEYQLWHILYSVSDKKELEAALGSFANKYSLDKELFVTAFKKCKPFENAYAAYSEKAIKKLLSVMRAGHYWDKTAISSSVEERINKILTGEFDENIDTRTREQCSKLSNLEAFSGLSISLACYVVYGRHSEAKEVARWTNPDDIDVYLKQFKQHSMRNPIVEQVVTETLRTVRDIWKKVGKIGKIHVELGREMKNPAAVRKNMYDKNAINEEANIRIKKLLQEFADPQFKIDAVRPYSPSQQSKLRIYEETVLLENNLIPEDVEAIIKKFKESDLKKQPSKSEVMRYKLWLEQQYRSPYTGEVIPLAKLFTTEYEIEHIIPQKRYFDDSFSNKVICEAEVNAQKGAMLGMEFIKNPPVSKITLSGGRVVTLLKPDAYEQFVREKYKKNKAKLEKLLMTEIPDGFNQRQLNDTRYISRFITGLLSNIVREENEIEAISRNVIPCTGGITDQLKQEWGLNDVWNDIVYPRFERLNEIAKTNQFGEWTQKDGKRVFQTNVPVELSKGFTKKRIDHRHHALDAIVIACTSRSHVNYLNNLSGSDSKYETRKDLKNKLCVKTKADAVGNYKWQFIKPWDTFTQDTKESLLNIVVGFKQNLRVINKTCNKSLHYNEKGEKKLQPQTGVNWAIRKSLHKDTVYGKVNLKFVDSVSVAVAVENCNMIVDKEVKKQIKAMLSDNLDIKKIIKFFKEREVKKIDIYRFTDDTPNKMVAIRKKLDTSFNAKTIETITDTGIQKILLAHLEKCSNDPLVAFSADGIEKMNEQIVILNGGKFHYPILKVRVSTPLGGKFAVGTTGNKSKKFVVADKGTNLFFAIYIDELGMRSYDSIPLEEVIWRLKNGMEVAEKVVGERQLLFTLSPNDLVYLPSHEQLNRPLAIKEIDKGRIYRVVSFTGNQCFFVPHTVSSVIVDKLEFQSLNKIEINDEGENIKKICIPIKVDRTGEIVKIL